MNLGRKRNASDRTGATMMEFAVTAPILFLFFFVSAVMGDIGIRFLAAPGLVAALTLVGLVVYLILLGATHLVFVKAGAASAFALATMTAQRNMGLMIAATGGLLPDMTWLYFAVSQFPIYFAPLALQPLTRRLTGTRE